MRFTRKETDNNVKCNQTRPRRNTSIQDRVVYAEHVPHALSKANQAYALSKANQAMTSDLLPNILCPRPDSLQEYWSSDTGTEILDKWFSIPKISQYLRTRSPVTMVDIDGWHVRHIITIF